jgi:hypothetical protein
MRVGRSFLIGPPGQASEALLLQDLGNRNGAEALALLLEQALNVINGEILFARLDNLRAQGVRLGGLPGAFGRRQEERTLGITAEIVDQNPEAARAVTEAASDPFGREFLDKVSPEGLILLSK